MREQLRDPNRLDHMLSAIDRLIETDNDFALDSIDKTDIRYFGIVKLLEIIGEAAYKLTNEFKDSHGDTPWKYIVNMRHILVHGYYQINHQDIVKTIRNDLPILRRQIQSYIDEFNL